MVLESAFKSTFAWKTGCILGASGVVLGAFGAHGLKKMLKGDLARLDNWKTASQYQLLHSVVLLGLGLAHPYVSPVAAKLIFGGTLGFSGSIYLLTLNPVAFKFLGPVTPIGGLAMIGGWLTMLI